MGTGKALVCKPLKGRRIKFADNLLNRKKFPTIKLAAIDAGYSAKTADTIGSEILANPSFNMALERKRIGKMDKASRFLMLAEANVEAKLANDPDGVYSASVLKLVADVGEQLGWREGNSIPQDTFKVRDLIRRIVIATLKCGLDRPDQARRILMQRGEGSTAG